MSYILNALRKSELQRKQGATETALVDLVAPLLEVPVQTKKNKLLYVFILLNVLVLLYLLWQAHERRNQIAIVQVDPVAVENHNFTQLVDQPKSNNLQLETSVLAEVKTPAHVLIKPEIRELQAKPALQATPVPKEVKKLIPQKTKEKPSAEGIANKVKEKPVMAKQTELLADEKEDRADVLPAKEVEVVAKKLSSSDEKIITVQPKASAREYKAPPADLNNLIPLLSQLSEELKAQIPTLTINVYAYADSATERFLIIDMAKYKMGDTIKGGVVLQNILPESAVFSINGQQFRLERP